MATAAAVSRPAPVPAALRTAILASLQPWLAAMNTAWSMPAYVSIQNAWGYSIQTVNPARSAAISAAARLLPAWYKNAAPYPNLHQGATPQTGYVPLRYYALAGYHFYSCPPSYGLNEGSQFITPSIAAGANGWKLPGFTSTATTVQGQQQLLGDWIFMGDPRPWMNIGQVGGGYTPGVSGKSITLQAATGIAIALSPLAVAAGVALVAGGVAAEGAGVGAGTGIGTGVGEATGAVAAQAIPIASNSAGILAAETATTGVLGSVGTVAGTVGGATSAAVAVPAVAAPAVAAPALAAGTTGGLTTAGLGTLATTAVSKLAGFLAPKPKQPVGGSGFGGGLPEGGEGAGFNYMWLLLIPLLLLIILFFFGRRLQG
jgi:hypothetical protein